MQKQTNIMYDVIIVGASRDGIETVIQLKHKVPQLKIAIVSTSFDKLLPTDKLNVDCVQAKVIFSEYKRGLIGLTLNNRTKMYCTNLIIATGTSATRLKNMKKELALADNVYYKLSDIPKQKLSKNNQIVVVGNSQEAVKAAITLSKKVTYVYLCSKHFTLDCTKELAQELKTTTNIAYLSGSMIVSFKANENKAVTSVTLDTYDKIHCTGVLVLLGHQVDDPGIASHMVAVNDEQQILVNKNCQTTIIPNIYAIGSCSTRSAKAAECRMIEQLIETNKWN